MIEWITDTLPTCEEKEHSNEVLVTVEKNEGKYRRVVRAIYFPYHQCTTEDMGWGMYDGIPEEWEYVENEDTWWIPDGWYEMSDYFQEYTYAEIHDKIVAWTPLPEPYKENKGEEKK